MSVFKFDKLLQSRPDPLGVLKTTAYVIEHARSVKIHTDSIERAADALTDSKVQPPAWNYDYHFFDGTPRTVNYLFLLDSLNFCFWGRPRWKIDYHGAKLDGYWALAAALKRAAEQNSGLLDGETLASVSPARLSDVLHGTGTIPLFVERWRNVRELGTGLRNLWEGDAARMVECAQHDAARLAQMVAETFSSFNDIAIYDNHEVHFFKRAQILVTDLWGAFGGTDWGEFTNIEVLTAFADYKLPQILRAWGILRYSSALARKVDNQIDVPAGSPEEIEIRSCTLWGVELLRQALAERAKELWSVQVDWILWQASQSKFKGMKPYHHTRTICY